jgi:hypothetical protein
MKLKMLIYSLLCMLMAAGCNKEAEVKPLEVQPLYSLPQGNHPYDNTIMEFYRSYGCYILYRFTEKDFRWNITNNIAYTAEQGDENYIEPALVAIDKYLFKFYPSDFLKKALPYKIILASRIKTLNQDNFVNSASSYSHLAFGRAGATLGTLTEAQLKVMKAELHREFWRQAVAYKKITLPPNFVVATNYVGLTNTAAVRRANGIFTVSTAAVGGTTIYTDFADYIYNIALQTPQEWEQSVFTATNDPAGRYRAKYNMIVSYFKETYGLDLQSISKN